MEAILSIFRKVKPKDKDQQYEDETGEDEANRSNPILFDIKPEQCPIIYSPDYDIRFFGIERLHPFDVRKWGKAHRILLSSGTIRPGQSVVPKPAETKDLLRVHTEEYMRSLKSNCKIATIAEVMPLALMPPCFLRSRLLKPLRFQTGGSILGTKLARERGWAINLGGGFHHASAARGGGFCYYADISLCVRFLLDCPEITRIMIIDLDAHQGNGHELDWGADSHVFILDMFNEHIYPRDGATRRLIRCPVPLTFYVTDTDYLRTVQLQVAASLLNFPPHFVIYNAGTDIMIGDPLGKLCISPQGIIERDAIIFSECRSRQIPILMLTSGGYQRQTAQVIADSIRNLADRSLINL